MYNSNYSYAIVIYIIWIAELFFIFLNIIKIIILYYISQATVLRVAQMICVLRIIFLFL
jgi:hypothetical protein